MVIFNRLFLEQTMKIDIMIEDLVIESVELKENFVAEVIDESVE